MDVRLGTTHGEPFDAAYRAGDVVPESGIYRVECHDQGQETAAFLRGHVFPSCGICGRRARYRLVQAAPYIHEDPDFAP